MNTSRSSLKIMMRMRAGIMDYEGLDYRSNEVELAIESVAFLQLFEANLKDNQSGFYWKDILKQIMYTAGVQGR